MISSEQDHSIPRDSIVVMTKAVISQEKKIPFSRQSMKVLGQIEEAPGAWRHYSVHVDEEKDGAVKVHTVTVWDSEIDMTAFVNSGAHADAVRAAGRFIDRDSFESYRATGADFNSIFPTKEEVIAQFNKPQAPQQRNGK